jgi:hypothetical protein
VCGQAQAMSKACSFCVKRYENHALLFTAGDPGYGGITSCQSNGLVDATGAHIACECGVTREPGVACWVSDAWGADRGVPLLLREHLQLLWGWLLRHEARWVLEGWPLGEVTRWRGREKGEPEHW